MSGPTDNSEMINALDALIAEQGEEKAEMTMPAVLLRQVFRDAEDASDFAEELKTVRAELSKAKSALAEAQSKPAADENETLLKEATQQLEAATAAVEEKNDRIAKLQAEIDKLKADKPKRGRPAKGATVTYDEQESEAQRKAREAMAAYRARFEGKIKMHEPPAAAEAS